MNLNIPLEEFLFASLAEYRKSLGIEKMTEALWKEHVAHAFKSWDAAKKARVRPRKPRIDSDDAWVMSVKADPRMEGIDVDKEIANCRFFFANKPQPIIPSRARLVNWLLKADKTMGGSSTPQTTPKAYPGPIGWLDWARCNLPDWRRFTEESEGRPVPAWHQLETHEQDAIRAQMKQSSASRAEA